MTTNGDHDSGFKMMKVEFCDDNEEILEHIFEKCTNIKRNERPPWIKVIGNFVFHACTQLREVKLSKGLINIGALAFFGDCESLRRIEIPRTVRSILESCAFGDCTYLVEVKLCEGIETIGFRNFKECTSLKNIEIPLHSEQLEFEHLKTVLVWKR